MEHDVLSVLVVDQHGRGHRRDHLLGHLLRALVVVVAQVLEDHRELVAAQARHGVGGAHAGREARRDALQQLVAHLVAERVVDGLEAVQVDEHEREPGVAARRVDDRLLEAIVEQHAVGQPGEGIARGEVLGALLGLLALRDVGRGPRHAQRPPVGVALRHLAARVHPDPVAARRWARGTRSRIPSLTPFIALPIAAANTSRSSGWFHAAHLVAGEGRLARLSAQQRRPALVEVDRLFLRSQSQSARREPGEREVEPLLGAHHLLLGALAQRDVARRRRSCRCARPGAAARRSPRTAARCRRDRRSRPRGRSRGLPRTPRESRARPRLAVAWRDEVQPGCMRRDLGVGVADRRRQARASTAGSAAVRATRGRTRPPRLSRTASRTGAPARRSSSARAAPARLLLRAGRRRAGVARRAAATACRAALRGAPWRARRGSRARCAPGPRASAGRGRAP